MKSLSWSYLLQHSLVTFFIVSPCPQALHSKEAPSVEEGSVLRAPVDVCSRATTGGG